MTEPTEPHLNVWRFGTCARCGAADSWVVLAIPKLATGEQFPQFGVCVTCEDRHWFGVDEIGESCPADVTEGRTHAVNYYVLCDVRRT